MSDDDGELSDSTRAALRIQQEIEGTRSPTESKASKASGSKQRSETHGAITGIALGEYAHKKGTPAHIKMKGGKACELDVMQK